MAAEGSGRYQGRFDLCADNETGCPPGVAELALQAPFPPAAGGGGSAGDDDGVGAAGTQEYALYRSPLGCNVLNVLALLLYLA